jgi:hypothetical protein
MKRNPAKTIIVSTILFLSISACYFGPPAEYRYYVLDYVPQTSAPTAAKEPWPASVLVRNFPIGEAYLRS